MIDLKAHSTLVGRIRSGPLGPHCEGFAVHLDGFSYAPYTIISKLRVMDYLNRWLSERRLESQALDEGKVAEFQDSVDGRYSARQGFKKSLSQLLDYLRAQSSIPGPMPGPRTDVDILIDEFGRYLTEERGLAVTTRRWQCELAGRFLTRRSFASKRDLAQLNRGDVTTYVLEEASRMTPTGAGGVVSGLRSFLRFLYAQGKIELDLARVVPAVLAARRERGLPVYLTPQEVKRVLDTCNRETAVGRRDYAILLTLSRLGLRGGELIRLTLDDIDWRRGELKVTGRPGRTERLPLPVDVGAALADYLRHGRPQCTDRRFFIRGQAPFHGLARAGTAASIVRRALRRARLNPPRQGTYLLRHTVATEMLRSGASYAEIGELLRHRHPDTTAIYAKVDLAALRELAPAWPEN